MRRALRSLGEYLRGSLFFVPMIYVVTGACAGQLSLVADERHLERDGVPREPVVRAVHFAHRT